MKFSKMSLIAVVLMGSISSNLSANASGKLSFGWMDNSLGESSINIISGHLKHNFASEDGNGNTVVEFRATKTGTTSSVLNLFTLSSEYKLGAVTLSAGPMMDMPGNFVNKNVKDRMYSGAGRAIGVTVDLGETTISAGAQMGDSTVVADARHLMGEDKQIVSLKTKAGPATIKADVQMSNGNLAYVGFVGAKVAGATINTAYAAKDTASIMGLEAKYKINNIGLRAGMTMSGAGGGNALFETDGRDLERVLGYHYKSRLANRTIGYAEFGIKLGEKTKLDIIGSIGTGDDSSRYRIRTTTALNTQSKVEFNYEGFGVDAMTTKNVVSAIFMSKF